MVSLNNELQQLKAALPMWGTESGRPISHKELQPCKARLPM